MILFVFCCTKSICAQNYIVKNIKEFGAKGDGQTNDQLAFEKASDFFNQRKGHGHLVIPKGQYLVGKQVLKTINKQNRFLGKNVLDFKNVRDLKVSALDDAEIKYTGKLLFGTFEPKEFLQLKKEYKPNDLLNKTVIADIGCFIRFESSTDIEIENIRVDGNVTASIIGGQYGDKGIQLPHFGVYLKNVNDVIVNNVNMHHFALDGIYLSNQESRLKDRVTIKNSNFEYNARQGFSWVGGNDLYVYNCKFNHTGKSKFTSPPGAGVDIEAEVGPIRNGVFEQCEFFDANGPCLVADSGNSGSCTFNNCTFWASTSWAIWVRKPDFNFINCKIYGSITHGYKAKTDKEATKFIDCYFEDKPYYGQSPKASRFIIESNHASRMLFKNCNIVARHKLLFWMSCMPDAKPEEKYQLINSTFTIYTPNLKPKSYLAVIRGIRMKNTSFYIKNNQQKNGYYLNEYNNYLKNIDLGGNKVFTE